MCGIVGYTGFREARNIILEGLTALEYRGYDSAGIALGGATLTVAKCSGRVSGLERIAPQSHARCGIGHTRWATHGAATSLNAHPHLSADGKIAIVHNGVIENHEELRTQLIAEGCIFVSDTDSEIIAHLIAAEKTDDMTRAVNAAAARIEGAATFLAVRENDPKIYCHRQGAALIVAHAEGESFVASDMLALAPFADKAVILEDGETAVLSPEETAIYRSGDRIGKAERAIKASKPRLCPCFMRSEIAQVPDALIRTYLSFKKTFSDPDCEAAQKLRRAKRVLLAGCGTAYHACLYGKEVIENFAEIPCDAIPASEIDRARFIDSDTFAIFISQSGETADTLSALRLCRELNAFTLAVTNVDGSSLTFEADCTLFIDAGPEIAVAATKSYNCQLLALYLLARNASCAQVAPIDIRALSTAAASLLGKSEFADLVSDRKLFFVGKGSDEITAREGALKFKEITYKMTDAYAAGELKHGTIALIDEDSAAVVIATLRADKKRIAATVSELKARGAAVIAVSAVGDIGADRTLDLPELEESCLYPILSVIPLQLLALSCACKLGLDPDKPRNLAKSVTVI